LFIFFSFRCHWLLFLLRGIALDDSDNVYVADSGNNRIQVFAADGQKIRAFGKWGGLPGEFKGLEGIAVNSRKDVIVADRENHRVQIFHSK
jgi:DNA-binding beta-propeller fold protein YncE